MAIGIDDAGFVQARRFGDFAALIRAFEDARVIGVDMPIGLVDAPVRAADQAARAYLAGAASSVFNAPVRAALHADSYEDASAISRRIAGKGLSKQSFHLMAKIREVDAHATDARIFEVHPEVSFRLMGDGASVPRKKSWAGMRRRLARLAREGIVLPDALGEADDVGIDDVIDAAAAAWSARRIANGNARSFPAPPVHDDATGRTIAIWG